MNYKGRENIWPYSRIVIFYFELILSFYSKQNIVKGKMYSS